MLPSAVILPLPLFPSTRRSTIGWKWPSTIRICGSTPTRSSGAGGQHVNVTDSAVRITHIPTGIVVQCPERTIPAQESRCGDENPSARLYELELSKKRAEAQAVEDSKLDIAWGSQIRSYVLAPYRMVKDHRTKLDMGDVDRVLDGDLETFIKAALQWKAHPGAATSDA